MDPRCAASVRAAAGGRTISDAKMKLIDEAMGANLRQLAKEALLKSRETGQPNEWLSMSKQQQMAAAVERAMSDLEVQAALKERQAGLQAAATDTIENIVADQMTRGTNVTRSQATGRVYQIVEGYISSVRNSAIAQLDDMLKAVSSTDGVGVLRNLGINILGLDNPQMTADVVREIFRNADGHTGNKMAQAGAKAWLSTIEQLRQRFNNAGGNIGKLGYGYLSQAHDHLRVMKAGTDAWVQKVLPLVDRDQYVRADGSKMDDAEIAGVLKAAWVTITEQGDNKTPPGVFTGVGKRANRGQEHRVLHFKDGDAWMEYMRDFGDGSLYDSMLGHLGSMSRSIGLVEMMGPNPEQTHRLLLDKARRADKNSGFFEQRSLGVRPDSYWQIISGNAGMPENRRLAFWGSSLRNIQTAAKITMGPFTALGDMGTVAATLHYNKLPYFEMLKATGRRLKPGSEEYEWLRSHEIISESLSNDINRMVGDHFTHNLTGAVTNGVMKLSLLNAWTDTVRGAFAATMMRNFSKKLGKGWDDLDAWDQQLLARKGITEAEWAVISKSEGTDRDGDLYVTAQAIRAVDDPMAGQVATKWLAYVMDETHFASVQPDVATRAMVTGGGLSAGTPLGETIRSVMQFKSFPIAMITRHLQRFADTPQGLEGAPVGYRGGIKFLGGEIGAKIGMIAAFGFILTLLGAMQTQGRQVLAGKDPIDMDPSEEEGRKFWKRAFAAGGGGGFFADVLMRPTDDPSFGFEGSLGMFGPVMGALGGAIDTYRTEKNQGARAVQWVNDQLPGVDIWYLKAMYEHAVLHNAQEFLNPGYLSRLEQRTQKNWGQSWWWQPGEYAPDRLPDYASDGQ